MPKYQDVNVGETVRVWSADGKLLATVAAADLILPPKIPSIPAQRTSELRDVQCTICQQMVDKELFPAHAKAHAEEGK